MPGIIDIRRPPITAPSGRNSRVFGCGVVGWLRRSVCRRAAGLVSGALGQVSAVWAASQTIRCILYSRLARPILVVARARPMVRMNRPIGPFCRAKTCSTAERTADLRALAWAVRRGIGLPPAFAGAGLYGALVVKPDDALCGFIRCRVSALARAQCRTIRGELASGRERSRYTLVFGRSAWTSTMMQSCASAAKLRDGRPIL